MQVALGARIISKAMDRETEAYSAFGDTALLVLLRDLRVARLFVGGVATDYCVHATVIDARAHGFQVVVLADAIRGINAQAGDDSRALSDMVEHGASLVQVHHAVS